MDGEDCGIFGGGEDFVYRGLFFIYIENYLYEDGKIVGVDYIYVIYFFENLFGSDVDLIIIVLVVIVEE